MAKSFLFFCCCCCCCCKSNGNSLVVCAGHLLNGLVADLERRTQVAFETNNNNFHVKSIQGIHRLLLQVILVDHHQAEPVLICLFFFSLSLSLSLSSFFLLRLVSPLKLSLDPSTPAAAAH
jgi:hypothetical protein